LYIIIIIKSLLLSSKVASCSKVNHDVLVVYHVPFQAELE